MNSTERTKGDENAIKLRKNFFPQTRSEIPDAQ